MIQSRLTSIGKMFLCLAALFYAAAVTSQSGLLLLLIGLIGGCLFANWFYSRNALQGLVVEPPRAEFIPEGSSPSHPWRITNKGKRVAEQVDLLSPAGRVLRIQMLRGDMAGSFTPELAYQSRGVYENRFLQLVTSAPFGLIRSVRRLDLPGETVVHPQIYEAIVPSVSGLDMMAGGKLSGNRRVTSGAHFAGVRQWQPGDPIRQIHWKSSARGPDLMVKTFDEELAGRLAFIISCDGATPELVDDCVRAAGSLMMAALQAGHQVYLWNFSSENFQPLPPFSDGTDLLHALARFQPEVITHWDLLAEKLPRKSAAALVAAALGDGERTFLRETSFKHRKTSLYLPAGVEPGAEADFQFHFDSGKIWAGAESGVLS